jgi:putative endonuclease
MVCVGRGPPSAPRRNKTHLKTSAPPFSPHVLGRLGEDAAQEYLKEQGYRIVKRGYRFGRGEIDIIAYDKDTLVFVEVKTGDISAASLPEESITISKQRQIRHVAQAYLYFHRLEDIPCRFDVMALQFDKKQGFQIRHYRDAFV